MGLASRLYDEWYRLPPQSSPHASMCPSQHGARQSHLLQNTNCRCFPQKSSLVLCHSYESCRSYSFKGKRGDHSHLLASNKRPAFIASGRAPSAKRFKGRVQRGEKKRRRPSLREFILLKKLSKRGPLIELDCLVSPVLYGARKRI